MTNTTATNTTTSGDPVALYATTVNGLHAKLGRVFENHQEIANSLSRAAAALRAMSTAGQRA